MEIGFVCTSFRKFDKKSVVTNPVLFTRLKESGHVQVLDERVDPVAPENEAPVRDDFVLGTAYELLLVRDSEPAIGLLVDPIVDVLLILKQPERISQNLFDQKNSLSLN